jgi:Zn-dependent protease with chaperone function/uncharacterized protein YgiM (DUF1202 family)
LAFSIALLLSPLSAYSGEDDGSPDEEKFSDDGESSGGGQNSNGGFLNSLFGDDSEIGKDGKLIDKINVDTLHFSPPPPGAPTGKDLARRKAFGPQLVPAPFPQAHAFTKGVIRRLADSIGFSGFVPKVEIVSNDLIWATAYPDGTVLVFLGALRNLESEDEFAAILAHELSHVVLGHHGSDWFMETQQRGLAVFNLVLDVKDAVEKARGKTDTKSQWDKYKNRLIAEAIVFSSEMFLSAPFNRDQEDESDLLGADILIKAGYNADGMALLLERLVAQEAKVAAEKSARAEKRRAAEGPQASGFFASLTDLFADIGSGLKDDLRSEFGNDHRKAEERQAFVSRYLGKQYAELPLMPMTTERWDALIKNTPNVGLVLEGYRDALSARNNLTDQDLPGSFNKIRSALGALEGGGHTLPYSVAAEISAAMGDYFTAADLYREALSQHLPTTGVYIGLSEALIRAGLPDEAAKTVLRGAKELKNPPQLLPSKIAISRIDGAKGVGDKFDSVALLAECRLEGLDALKKQCELATKGEYTVFGKKLSREVLRQAAGLGPIRGKARKVRITRNQLNARRGPGTNFPTIASYGPTDTLTVVGKSEKWLKVRDHKNKITWVAGWLTKPVGQTSRKASARGRKSTPPVNTSRAQTRKTPPQTQTPSSAPKPDDTASRLRKLKTLFTQGLITELEYKQKRQAIVDSL